MDKRRHLAGLLALAFTIQGCGGGDHSSPRPIPAPPPGAQDEATAWEIGPIVQGSNISQGMPLHPSVIADGLAFDFPQPNDAAGHVHSLTFVHGPLKLGNCLNLRYRITADSGVRILPRNYPTNDYATAALFFQRKGDDWSGQGAKEAYRWYGTSQPIHLEPGAQGEVQLCRDDLWTAVISSSSVSNRAAFLDAWANAERVGFVLGGGTGWAHGVYATGPARMEFNFTVEPRQ